MSTWVVAVDADAAVPTVTSLTSESFNGTTTADPGWVRPSTGTNGACLTAGTDTTQVPIPACSAKAGSGPGTLHLTDNATNRVGTVYSTASFPTTQGVDVRFATYQWNSPKVSPGADGIAFILAATDPTNPAPPVVTGPLGGSLGYSATAARGATAAVPGVTNGYLGFGLDVFGNYTNSAYGGSGCATTAKTAQNVTVRGPGNGTAGYCIAGTQAVTTGTLDSRTATARPTPVPVEIALNPASSPTTSLGGVPVAAHSWLIAYTPAGAAQQTLTGTLPTPSELRGFGFPASYYDPVTGAPYQLTFGWAASTGGNYETHEINNLVTSTLNGQLPDLDVAASDDQGGALLAGSSATLSVAPSVSASQGPEARPVTVTTTFPSGLTPSNPTTNVYRCSTVGQVVSCTYTPVQPIMPGQPLPTLELPVEVGPGAASGLTITSKVSSTDANPAQAARTVSVVAFGARATPASVAYGASSTLSATGLPGGATGTVAFASGGLALCTAILPSTSCTTSSTLTPATYAVTATYGGDGRYTARTATTSFDVTRATPALSAGVSDTEVTYGTPDVLAFSGLPATATGSLTFTSGSTTLCVVHDVTVATSCTTASDLEVRSYPVTATYGGDAGFAPSTATTSFSVRRASVDLTASASPGTAPYGTAETLAVGGLPADATGNVAFTTDDGTVLCTIADVASATSCPVSTDLAPGDHPVTAVYAGDARHGSAQATTSFSVVKADTVLVARTSDAAVPFGTSSTLSFTGLPSGVTGTVTFTTGSRTLCTVDVTEASSCPAPDDLRTGEHVVTGSYSGDDRFHASSGQTSLTVTPKGSPDFRASAADPAPAFGTTDTLSFSGLADGATGSVTFVAAGRTLCAIADVTTSSSCTTADDLGVGRYAVTASYSGDDDHAAESAPANFRVERADTGLTAAVASPTVVHGVAQTLSFGGLPARASGTVTFTDGTGDVLCTVRDVGEATSCSTSETLTSGSHAVTADYSGDDSFTGSSATTSFTVTRADVDLVAGVSSAAVPWGTADTLSYSGVPEGATGVLTFSAGERTLCVVEDVTATASCSTSPELPVAAYAVTATYSGDGDHAPATATTGFAVLKVATDLTASVQPSAVPYGTAAALVLGGLPAAATGSVTFSAGDVALCTVDDVHAADRCTAAAGLLTGDHHVTATYSGDGHFAGSRASTDVTVVRAGARLDAAAASGSVPSGTAETLTFTGLPSDATGGVTFTSGDRTLCTVDDVSATTSCATAADLGAGDYPVVATYSGDSHYLGTTATTGFSVRPGATPEPSGPARADTHVTAQHSDHPVAGSTVTLTASSLPDGATGTVTFGSGGADLCTATLPQLSCETAALAAGNQTVTVRYSGDGRFKPSSSSLQVDVAASNPGGSSSGQDGDQPAGQMLARTGGPGLLPLVGGLLLLGGGTWALALDRRRRRRRRL